MLRARAPRGSAALDQFQERFNSASRHSGGKLRQAYLRPVSIRTLRSHVSIADQGKRVALVVVPIAERYGLFCPSDGLQVAPFAPGVLNLVLTDGGQLEIHVAS